MPIVIVRTTECFELGLSEFCAKKIENSAQYFFVNSAQIRRTFSSLYFHFKSFSGIAIYHTSIA